MYKGKRILSEESVRAMHNPRFGGDSNIGDFTGYMQHLHLPPPDARAAWQLRTRATLELLAVGAPPSLLAAAQLGPMLVLGLPAVRTLALGFSLLSSYRDGACKGFDYSRYWTSCLVYALAMQAVTQRTRAAAAEETFCLGLLGNIHSCALRENDSLYFLTNGHDLVKANPSFVTVVAR